MRRLVWPLAGLLSLLLLLQGTTVSAQNLTMTLAATPPAPGVITTRSVDNLSLQVMSGASVSLSRSTGRDYQLQASGGFFWTQVQEVPRDAESVALNPVLQEDGTVQVGLAVARKNGTAMQSHTATVVALPGEWVQLFGPAPSASRSTKVYGTQTASQDSLYLLVEY